MPCCWNALVSDETRPRSINQEDRLLLSLRDINVGGMPGVEGDAAFWIVVAMCFGLTELCVLFWYSRNLK
jgi:hypothetical protein